MDGNEAAVSAQDPAVLHQPLPLRDHFVYVRQHGSRFAANGDVIHGPAAYSLSHLDWKQGSSPNQILVQGLDLKGIG